MRKIRSVLGSVLMYAFALYFYSASAMFCYYWWKDVKTHDGFIRAVLWSPSVGMFKATHWPYYAFIQGRGVRQTDPPSLLQLEKSISYYNSAYMLGKNLQSSSDPHKDAESVMVLFRQAKSETEKIDKAELNSIKPGLGDAVAANYLQALTYYNAALADGGDRNELARGDAAIARFSIWMAENMGTTPVESSFSAQQ